METQEYLDHIKLRLATSPVVKEAQIVQERRLEDHGFFRARLRLTNDDFVEVAEYFIAEQGRVRPIEYRFQWMDPARKHLRKRWDNAPHHPDLPGFPFHEHVGDENQVEPGMLMSTVDLIDLFEQLIDESI